MKTTTGNDVLYAAAELALRTRDKLPPQEQTMLQGYIAAEFGELFNAQWWPELIPLFYNVQNIANRTFSKNEGQANPPPPEMGDILAITSQDPRATDYYEPVEWDEGDNCVVLDSHLTSVWVEYMPPYPGVLWPDMDPAEMTLANFLVAAIPYRFKKILAHRAAGYLLGSDGNSALGGVQLGLAEKMYNTQVNRLPAPPDWRRIRVRRNYGKRHHGHGGWQWGGLGP